MNIPRQNLYDCLVSVSRSTGCVAISLILAIIIYGVTLLLLKVVGQVNALDDLMPELPESPYLIRKEEKKAQRIRHPKK